MGRYLKYIRKYIVYFIFGPIMMLTEVFGEIWIPKLMSLIIDNGVGNHDTAYIIRVAFVMIGACLLMICGGTLGNYFAVRASVRSSADLRSDIFHKIQDFSFADVDRFSTGSLVTRLTNDIQQVQQLIITMLKMALRSPGMLVGAFIMALKVNSSLAFILLIVIPLLGISIFLIMKSAYPRFERMQTALDNLNNGIQETLTNIRVVKSFVREDHEKDKFDGLNSDMKQKSLDAMNIVIFIQPVMTFFMNATAVAVVWFGGNRIIAGSMQVGELTAFITYVTQILMSLMMLAMVILQSSRAMASFKRISDVIDYEPGLSDADARERDKKVQSGSIEFRHVYFGYNDADAERAAGNNKTSGINGIRAAVSAENADAGISDEAVNKQNFGNAKAHAGTFTENASADTMILKDISFKVASGETIGILGATGCGKTSMVQLIPRLYDVSSGEVLVDGTDVRDYSLYNLREGVAMVLQYNTLFTGTVAENLRWGNENASDEDIIRFAGYAQADSFVTSSEGGYERMVEQGGSNFSGGQKQRLCIARALLKKPRILILDDSTSAVDTATERKINEAFANELKDTTKLIISQRIASVRNADRIIVLDDGRIADIGAHDELMARCSLYQEIYYSQNGSSEETADGESNIDNAADTVTIAASASANVSSTVSAEKHECGSSAANDAEVCVGNNIAANQAAAQTTSANITANISDNVAADETAGQKTAADISAQISNSLAADGTDGQTTGRTDILRASLKKRYGNRMAESKRRGPGGPGGPRMRNSGQTGKPNDYRKTIRRLAAYLSSEKARLLLAVICVIFATGAMLASSYMLRPIINTYIAPADGSKGDPAGLAAALVLMAAVYLVGIAGTYTQSRLLIRVGQNSLKRMREDLFAHMQKLPVRFYDTNTRGDLMSRFTNDIDNIGNMLSSTLISLFTAALTLIGTLTLMLYTNVMLTLVTVVVVPFMLTAARHIATASARYFKAQQSALGALNGYIEENVAGQKVVKVFNHEAVCDEEFDILNDELCKNQMRAQFYSGLMGPVMNCSTQINYTLTAAVGGMLCILRGLDIGALTVFLNYSRMFNRPVNEISMTISAVFSALAGAERVFAVMDEQGEQDGKNSHELRQLRGDIVMQDVSFGYEPGKTILKAINVYAHPGQKIAFVGSTGAGKTTVMNLLPRFYDIDEGSITIDGRDIKSYSMKELRSNITMVLQESHLFSGTIMENIRYGRLDATDEEVVAAAVTASADSFIRHLPKGYNTVIDADGSNLSQGQRQLLNIARAAISKAPILILDEATSSVDTRTEKLIERGMDSLMSTRTTFIIAHRLSTVRDADAIMVLENGEITERGRHEELLKAKGRYYELYTGKRELS